MAYGLQVVLPASARSGPTSHQDLSYLAFIGPSPKERTLLKRLGHCSSVTEAWKQDALLAGTQGTDLPAWLSDGEHPALLCSAAQLCWLERSS